VRVTAGAIFDVIVDVRAGSATYGQWFGVELSAANRKQIYIPAGFAHGFQTLVADTEVTYHISAPYAPEHADGLIWNDPGIGIRWPAPDAAVLSERDASLKPLADFEPVPC
jgi:dTDP-4-dehydrorhamnose 3,5-epimerase